MRLPSSGEQSNVRVCDASFDPFDCCFYLGIQPNCGLLFLGNYKRLNGNLLKRL